MVGVAHAEAAVDDLRRVGAIVAVGVDEPQEVGRLAEVDAVGVDREPRRDVEPLGEHGPAVRPPVPVRVLEDQQLAAGPVARQQVRVGGRAEHPQPPACVEGHGERVRELREVALRGEALDDVAVGNREASREGLRRFDLQAAERRLRPLGLDGGGRPGILRQHAIRGSGRPDGWRLERAGDDLGRRGEPRPADRPVAGGDHSLELRHLRREVDDPVGLVTAAPDVLRVRGPVEQPEEPVLVGGERAQRVDRRGGLGRDRGRLRVEPAELTGDRIGEDRQPPLGGR